MSEAPWAFVAYPELHHGAAGQPQGLDLLHLQQHPLPGLQPGAERAERAGPIVTVDAAARSPAVSRRRRRLRVLPRRPAQRTRASRSATRIVAARDRCSRCSRPGSRPYRPRPPIPTVFLLPPGLAPPPGHRRQRAWTFLSRVICAPRIDLVDRRARHLALGPGRLACSARSSATTSGQRASRRLAAGFVMRAADVLQAFPVFVFAIALVAVFGQSLQSIVLAIAFVNAPIYLRLMRSQVMCIRTHALCRGGLARRRVRTRAIIVRHVVPNAMAPVLAQLSVNIGWSVLLTAGTELHRRRRGGADSRMGQHDRHGIPEHRHRPMVALCLSRASRWPSPSSASRWSARASRCWPIPPAAGACPAVSGRPRCGMTLLPYIGRRLLFVLPQLVGSSCS